MSQFWYADLLQLQIVGLVAVRLAQMEQQLQPLLRNAIMEARKACTKPQVTVPDFDEALLRLGWRRRSRVLSNALRGAVLRDADRHATWKARARAAGANEMLEGAANDDQFIDAVQLFLARTDESEPVNDGSSWISRRRAFDDLDVAVGTRFDKVAH